MRGHRKNAYFKGVFPKNMPKETAIRLPLFDLLSSEPLLLQQALNLGAALVTRVAKTAGPCFKGLVLLPLLQRLGASGDVVARGWCCCPCCKGWLTHQKMSAASKGLPSTSIASPYHWLLAAPLSLLPRLPGIWMHNHLPDVCAPTISTSFWTAPHTGPFEWQRVGPGSDFFPPCLSTERHDVDPPAISLEIPHLFYVQVWRNVLISISDLKDIVPVQAQNFFSYPPASPFALVARAGWRSTCPCLALPIPLPGWGLAVWSWRCRCPARHSQLGFLLQAGRSAFWPCLPFLQGLPFWQGVFLHLAFLFSFDLALFPKALSNPSSFSFSFSLCCKGSTTSVAGFSSLFPCCRGSTTSVAAFSLFVPLLQGFLAPFLQGVSHFISWLVSPLLQGVSRGSCFVCSVFPFGQDSWAGRPCYLLWFYLRCVCICVSFLTS